MWFVVFILEVFDGYFIEFFGYLVDIFGKWLNIMIFVSNVFMEFVLNVIEEFEGSSDGFVRWMCYFVV